MRFFAYILCLFFFSPGLAFSLTRAELLTQLGALETQASVIEGHLKLAEGGAQPIKSKHDLLTDLAHIKEETERVKRDIDALPVVPIVDSISPAEALPGSEVVVRGFGFRAGDGNYAVIRYGNAPTEAVAVPVSVLNSATARFSLPSDYALFGTYRTSVFMAGAGESNTRNFQVLKPVAVGGAPLETGAAGVINAVVVGAVNLAGNVITTTPTPASPAQVLPSAFIESVEPRELIPGGTLTVVGRGFAFNTSHLVLLTDAETNETQQLSSRNIETASGVHLEVELPQSLRAGQYSIALANPRYGQSNTRSFSLLAAVASTPPTQPHPPPQQPPPQQPPPQQPPPQQPPPQSTEPLSQQSKSQADNSVASDLTIVGLLNRLRDVLDALVPFLIGLAVFVILWGIFNYITHAAEEEKRAEARQYIVWGVVGIFFMLSVWGFVSILANTLNLETTISESIIPRIPTLCSPDQSSC